MIVACITVKIKISSITITNNKYYLAKPSEQMDGIYTITDHYYCLTNCQRFSYITFKTMLTYSR